jgi:hypothetical protein
MDMGAFLAWAAAAYGLFGSHRYGFKRLAGRVEGIRALSTVSPLRRI